MITYQDAHISRSRHIKITLLDSNLCMTKTWLTKDIYWFARPFTDATYVYTQILMPNIYVTCMMLISFIRIYAVWCVIIIALYIKTSFLVCACLIVFRLQRIEDIASVHYVVKRKNTYKYKLSM